MQVAKEILMTKAKPGRLGCWNLSIGALLYGVEFTQAKFGVSIKQAGELADVALKGQSYFNS